MREREGGIIEECCFVLGKFRSSVDSSEALIYVKDSEMNCGGTNRAQEPTQNSSLTLKVFRMIIADFSSKKASGGFADYTVEQWFT